MTRRTNFDPKNLHGRNLLRRPKSIATSPTHEITGAGLLIQPGLGAAFQSSDQMNQLLNRPTVGLGLSQVSEKLKSMKNARFVKKPKNISFTL